MKVLLYASLSANGYVLLATNPDHQIPPPILMDFMGEVKKTRNIIIGRKTYELLTANPAAKENFAGIDVIVVSRKLTEAHGFTMVRSPQEALDFLTAKKHDTALLAGGGELYSAFIEEGLVDNVYLNINPVITGKGGLLVKDSEKTIDLQLTAIKKLTDEVAQLRYAKK